MSVSHRVGGVGEFGLMSRFSRLFHRIQVARLLGLGLAMAAPVSSAGASPDVESDSPSSPWRLASRGLVEEAHEEFSRLGKSGGENRESRFGMAVTLLNVQPETAGNVERAYRLLREIRDENLTDHYGISAQYFLGRIDQVHRSSPDRESARRHFTVLIERYREHPLAQLAVVKLSILDLYDPTNDNLTARFAQVEGRVGLLWDRPAKRDFHLLLAEAYDRYKLSKSKSLEHLLAAEMSDPSIVRSNPEFAVLVADLARELGEVETAILYYRVFMKNFRRDARRFQVEQVLEGLGSVTKSHLPSNPE